MAIIKWVQVRMLMDSLGSLTLPSALVEPVSLPAQPLVCLLIQAHKHALCAHKDPSVKLIGQLRMHTVSLMSPFSHICNVGALGPLALRV